MICGENKDMLFDCGVMILALNNQAF